MDRANSAAALLVRARPWVGRKLHRTQSGAQAETLAAGDPRWYSDHVASTAQEIRIRPLSELDISRVVAIDERLTGVYRPEVWERRVGYYLRRDPDSCPVAEIGGTVVGFMFSDVRGGEFGLEETTGWIERFGVDPDFQGRSIGRRLFEAVQAQMAGHGVKMIRTLVDKKDSDLASFLRAVGFENAALQALEMKIPAEPPPARSSK
ncbi:MAG: GNAT family N-acetyltransferase [Candidatus Eisenbacteria bacterium]|uniref:GNAT family N-acetyltransferase n=1 Tax=Eiseniibacteriota bacterium TaxID=2212470 RepID=A0A538TNM9_UNCEI|nr:MAG: GNAT family N-acetyltransferase [Candidatus Eisenbacteria bacterium]